METKNIDLPTLVTHFANEDACHAYLESLRWSDGLVCPGRENKDGTRVGCGSVRVDRLAKRRLFQCRDCGYQFSTRVGTVLHDSKLPLWKWFLAVYMMCQSKKGVSANQLKRMLGVSYKTAWYLCHRIRQAMKTENAPKLTGTVEVDETFLGGKAPSRTRYRNKSVVMAAVERGGEVRLREVPSRKAVHVKQFIRETVSGDADNAYTDDYAGYRRAFGKKTAHGSVRHSPLQVKGADGKLRTSVEWVNGNIHTNTVEGVFSLLDRSIMGAFHKVSKKHLHRYLGEVEWRYNNRKNEYLFRDTVLELIREDRVEYKSLVA